MKSKARSGTVTDRKCIRAATALAVLATIGTSQLAAAASRHAAMVIDANTGETLHADQADAPRFPASLTKMMTIYMVFEMIEAGRLTLSTKLKVSQEAAAAQPTKLDVDPGEQIAVIDAVKSLITKSANDMAIVLAEAIGGTEAHFAELMTEKARALGMRNTTFRNASGLPDSRQVTTARDMLTLALRLQDDFPKHYPLFATRSLSYNGSTVRNHNTLLGSFEGIDGIKTGYTRMSGFNLVSSLRRGDKHLVATVFGGTTAGTRNATMRLLLTRSLLKASTKKTRKPAAILVARAKPAAPIAAGPIAPAPVVVAARLKPVVVAAARQQVAAVAPLESVVQVVDDRPPAFEIARVRPVMVAPRMQIVAPVAIDKPQQSAAPDTVRLAGIASEPRPVSASGILPARPQQTFRTPTTVPTMAAPQGAEPGIVRGSLPSTFQAQAQSLTRPGPLVIAPTQPMVFAQAGMAPAARPRGPVPPAALSTPATTGVFHIQIGAFATTTEADRVLRDTQSRAGALLTAARPLTAPVQKENRMLYRARFAGFTAQSAANTCLELRRAAIDCFVMKGE